MLEVASPRTPSPELATRYNDSSSRNRNGKTIAPIPDRTMDNITPPPSSQYSKAASKSSHSKMKTARQGSLASPPATLKTAPPITSVGLYGEVPTSESIGQMDEEQLRRLVLDLLPALGEARVTAAHSKLQHSLLAIENEEAAKRAEVEHEATRREVQILQEGGSSQRHGISPRSPHASLQGKLQLTSAHCRELQIENAEIRRHLRKSKKLIAQLHGENVELAEKARLLRQRVKANRDHLNEMQSSGAISLNGTPMLDHNTPLTRETPRTPATSRAVHDLREAVGSQTPFDTLLFAGQILNGEATSVPATPSPTKPRKNNTQHIRGAHSLSSLPSTPEHFHTYATNATADEPLGHPIYHFADRRMTDQSPRTAARYTHVLADGSATRRHDRDSTISLSDNESDIHNEQEIPGSQASQRATDMLKRNLDPNPRRTMQATLTAPIRKPQSGSSAAKFKRMADDDDADVHVPHKMAKTGGTFTERRNSVGLGIVR